MDKKAKVANFDDDHLWYPSYFQVVDVNILKKADGRMVGCAFVEFKKVTEATNALKDLNSSQMLGRLVIKQKVDLVLKHFSGQLLWIGLCRKRCSMTKRKRKE